ncbi:MAG: RecQ family ATP-dependent DNA helicase [Patescibacteria group bacterium]|nr:RecQ family ATP-dependent DNA helicase [Patescibacteria group bacterium]
MNLQAPLKEYFGYEEFRPGQEEIIRHVLDGKDALVIMPTGGGKSLCFQLPALMLDGVTLVVSPLISLMKDQVDALNSAGVPAAFINSTLRPNQIADVQSEALAGRLKIIYVAPERFAVPSFADFLSELSVSLIAVDEAHCISEWGHDFRPNYRNLQSLRQRFKDVPVLALTATATDQVRRDIAEQLGLGGGRIFITSFDRPNLSYSVWPKKKSLPKLIGLLRGYENESVIVYCSSRKTTEKVAESLRDRGIAAKAYHAGLETAERHQVQEQFIRDEVQVVVATIAFGMGIDKPDVRLVVHHDSPKTIENYYQETGRAGRDGLPARCVLFYTYGDRHKQLFIINQSDDPEERRKAVAKLDLVIRFCSGGTCRRRFLLGYFGERYAKGNCGGCDICEPDLSVTQAVEEKTFRRVPAGKGDPVLFNKLRQLRKDLADERDVPAFVIFGDRTLHELADRQPKTLADMADIFGVGAKKLDDFGAAFLAVIQAHEPSPDSVKKPRLDTRLETKRLLEQGLDVGQIAERRGLTTGSVMSHLEDLAEGGDFPDVAHLQIEPKRLAKIGRAFKQTETDRLAPVRELLGEEYSYDELRMARLLLKLQVEAI